MNTERAQVGWSFWLGWVLVNTVGLAGSFIVAGAVGVVVDYAEGSVMGIILSGAVFGALLGVVQWLVLRRRVSRSGWWVLASTVGGAVGGAMALVMDEAQIFAIVLAVGGASVGIAQWLVLRRQVAQAGWWVLSGTVVGGIVGGAVDLVLGGTRGWDLFVVIMLLPVGGIVALAGYGAITGGVLVWLLRQSAAKELGPRQVNRSIT
jgi:hypothetical protein